MDLVVMYAIENVCQKKVSYDTPIVWFSCLDKQTSTVLYIDSLDFEWVFNEIENMTGVMFDDDLRCWFAERIKAKKITVSDLIRDIETQSMLIRSKKIAARNPAGHPKSLKQEKLSLLKMDKSGPRCALTDEKCDKISQEKTDDIQNVCVNSNCKIAQNFYRLAQKIK